MIDADLPTRRPESGQRESLGARSQFVRFTLHVAIVMLTWWETDDGENISRGLVVKEAIVMALVVMVRTRMVVIIEMVTMVRQQMVMVIVVTGKLVMMMMIMRNAGNDYRGSRRRGRG